MTSGNVIFSPLHYNHYLKRSFSSREPFWNNYSFPLLPLPTPQKASSLRVKKATTKQTPHTLKDILDPCLPLYTTHTAHKFLLCIYYVCGIKKYQPTNYRQFKISSKPQNTGKPIRRDPGRTNIRTTSGQIIQTISTQYQEVMFFPSAPKVSK